MDLITTPNSYEVCFSIASLVLLLVTLLIHLSEEKHFRKQGHIFGALVFDALLLTIMGLLHSIYISSPEFKELIGSEVNSYIAIAEKILTHMLPYLSISYVMSIFQIEPDTLAKKALIIVPTLGSLMTLRSAQL